MGKNNNKKPVEVGEKKTIRIESEGTIGDGITRIGETGFVIVTKKAEVGKTYEILIQGVYNTYAMAKIIREITNPKEINQKLDKEEDE